MAITTMTNTTVNAYNSLPKFASLYLAYDDDALKTYANAGLLRRAKKDVDAGKVALSDSEANNSSDNSGGNSTIELISDGQHVILPAKGLVEAQCDCTSVSSCKHIVASVLYLQTVIQAGQTGQATQNGQSSDKHTDDLEKKSTKKTVDTDFTNESKHKSKNQSKGQSKNQPDALSEILALSLEDIQKIAKKIPKAKRLKTFNMALSYFDSFPINLDSIFDKHDSDNKKPQPNTTIINDSHSLTIQLANQSEPIRYIKGAGFVGMLSKIGRDADSYHLLALLEVKRHYYQYHQPIQQQSRQNADSTTNSKNSFEIIKNWIITTLKSDNNNNNMSNQTPYSAYQLPNDTLAMLDDITFDIHQLLTQGLSNMDSYLANRMHLNNTLARSHHLPRLASQLRQLSGQIHDYSLGSMHASERQILLSLAELSAYIYQLKNSVGDTLIKLRGKLRQRYDNDSKRTDLTLQPLGANWWHSDGKARGLTLYFYEPNEHQIIELTQARAQAQDPTFDKYSAWYHAVWMTSASQLMHQTSTLHNPRFNEDSDFRGANFINTSSKLAVTGSHVTHSACFDQTGNKSDSQTNFSAYLHSINAIAYDDWATLEKDWRQQMLQDDGIAPVVVLNPAIIGALLIDEIEQCVWWQLQDAKDNQIRLRLDWNSNEHTSIAKIKKLERLNLHDIQMVVARVGFNNGTSSNCIELAPVSLVMQHDLFHLDYDDVPNKKHTLKDLLSGKISKLMSKKRRLVEIESNKPTTPTTLTQLVCEPILDVLDSLCASGRLQPTSNQLNTLRQQYKLASDAGLSILASAIKPVFEDSSDNSTDYSNNHITDAGMNDSIKDTAKTQDKDRLQPILKLAYLCKQMQFLQIEMPIFSDNY